MLRNNEGDPTEQPLTDQEVLADYLSTKQVRNKAIEGFQASESVLSDRIASITKEKLLEEFGYPKDLISVTVTERWDGNRSTVLWIKTIIEFKTLRRTELAKHEQTKNFLENVVRPHLATTFGTRIFTGCSAQNNEFHIGILSPQPASTSNPE